MENIFILNPAANWLDIIDAISERISKAKAVTSCLLANSSSEAQLPPESIYKIVWAINEYLAEADYLHAKLSKSSDSDLLPENQE